jgi:hypothetical protein
MSSDIPSTGHATSLAMAKVLVTYLDCPRAIHQRIREEFDHPPEIRTIRFLREQHLAARGKPVEASYNACDAYWPAKVGEDAEKVSLRFLTALQAERDLSEQRALRSNFLTQPALVDRRFDREVEAAWRSNGELAA